ncbi:Arm DNA-binding domain-containing protein [Granulicella paludicola]|nr:Arm DNA-binding domain-containing protein [Granulicella paludicola]
MDVSSSVPTSLLTITEIENAKPKAEKYEMLDGGGLSLLVLPTGTKL